MLTTQFDLLRGHVTIHTGSPMTTPPRHLGGNRWVWADGEPDSGLIDWGEDLAETPSEKG